MIIFIEWSFYSIGSINNVFSKLNLTSVPSELCYFSGSLLLNPYPHITCSIRLLIDLINYFSIEDIISALLNSIVSSTFSQPISLPS